MTLTSHNLRNITSAAMKILNRSTVRRLSSPEMDTGLQATTAMEM